MTLHFSVFPLWFLICPKISAEWKNYGESSLFFSDPKKIFRFLKIFHWPKNLLFQYWSWQKISIPKWISNFIKKHEKIRKSLILHILIFCFWKKNNRSRILGNLSEMTKTIIKISWRNWKRMLSRNERIKIRFCKLAKIVLIFKYVSIFL